MTEIGGGSSNGSSDEFNSGHGGRLSTLVMVQREMENWRSPLASLPPSSAGHLGEHGATQVATGELGGG